MVVVLVVGVVVAVVMVVGFTVVLVSIMGRCKKYSTQTDQTDQTGQITKYIFGESQVGSLAWD